jgi:hypothetical protein
MRHVIDTIEFTQTDLMGEVFMLVWFAYSRLWLVTVGDERGPLVMASSWSHLAKFGIRPGCIPEFEDL